MTKKEEIQVWIEKAEENIRAGDMFYIAQALLSTKDLSFKSHGEVISAYGKNFAKTGLLDPKFHSGLIRAL